MASYMHIQGQSGKAALSPSLLAGTLLLLGIWLAAIVALGAAGAFEAAPSEPPFAVVAALAGPPLAFLALIRLWPALRARVLAIDPVWLTAMQGLRAIGVGFLFLAAFGQLPGLFAHPAGWGDLLVALIAPLAAARLARDPGFLRSAWLWRYHALGLADFAGAVGTALLARGTFPALVEGTTTQVIGALPLILVPAFAVPLWICLHVAAFVQIAEARKA